MNNFDDIYVFSKVAQCASYTKAAQQLGIPLPTVSRRVRKLEHQMGVQLINRNTRKLSLTEAGQFLYMSSVNLLAQLSDIERETFQFQMTPAGDLKVTVPIDISVNLLNDIIADFAIQYPEINIDVHMTNEVVDIIKEGVDVAIRGGALEDSNLVHKRLMSSKLYFCCSTSYLEEHGLLGHPSQQNTHHFLIFKQDFYQLLHLSKADEHYVLSPQNKACANNFDYLLKAAIKGMGIAILPASHCFQAIADGELITVLNDWSSPEVALYALYPNRTKTKKLDLFLSFVQNRLAAIEQHFPA